MFGFIKIVFFRSKVLAILKDEFDYEPSVPGIQQVAFNSVTKESYNWKGNEYDAAISFMLVQLNTILSNNEGRDASQDVLSFVKKHVDIISNVFPKSKGLAEEWIKIFKNSSGYKKYYA